MVIGWVGLSIYGNLVNQNQQPSLNMPNIKKAAYSVYIVNTSNLVLTNEYEKRGDTYILRGYWELIEQDWQYRSTDIILDQVVFGEIIIKRRD